MPGLGDLDQSLGHLHKDRAGLETEDSWDASGARSHLDLVPLNFAFELDVGGRHDPENALFEYIFLEVLERFLCAQLETVTSLRKVTL